MKILIAHNRYSSSSPSGENEIVDDEIELMRSAGLTVKSVLPESDSLQTVRTRVGAIRATMGASDRASAFRLALDSFNPDLVHVHNNYPLLGPRIFAQCQEKHIPVVQTVHNYRLTCLNGKHVLDEQVCTRCVSPKRLSPGVMRGCYRQSRVQSAAIAYGRSIENRQRRNAPNLYISLSSFMTNYLTDTVGINADDIVERPTWCYEATNRDQIPDSNRSGIAYIGRLSTDKGIGILLEALTQARKIDHRLLPLKVGGAGPLKTAVVDAARVHPDRIKYLGLIDREQVRQVIAASLLVMAPSKWWEGYPRVFPEAWSSNVAVASSSFGSLGSIINDANGYVFGPSSEEIAQFLAQADIQDVLKKGRAARAYYDAHCSPSSARTSLLEIYSRAVTRRS